MNNASHRSSERSRGGVPSAAGGGGAAVLWPARSAAERTSQQIEQLRKEIRRQNEQPGTKTAGFQVAPDDNG